MISWIRRWSEFIKFEHTLFALPFGLAAMVTAARGLPESRVFFGVLICLVGARTAAMAFNRLADWQIDVKNPRTAMRSTLVTKTAAWVTVAAGVGGLVTGAWLLNPLCLILSPLAVGIVFFYSLTKRFTWASHGFLGLALGTAPMGGWLAVTGKFDSWLPVVLGLAVGLWVAGFDVIYSVQDREFDRKEGLFSFPAKFGEKATLRMAVMVHGVAVVLLGLFGWMAGFGWGYGLMWGAVGVVLGVECRVLRSILSQKEAGFRLVEVVTRAHMAVSLLVLGGVVWEIFWR